MLRRLMGWLTLTIVIVAAGLWAFDAQRLGAGLFLGSLVMFVIWVLINPPSLKKEWERNRAGFMWGDQ